MGSVDWTNAGAETDCNVNEIHYIRAECRSEKVMGMNKGSIGILLTVFDIILVFLVYLGYQIEGSFESLEEREIEEQTLTGSDFTV